MGKVSEVIRLSASDLVNHLACRRLTELNHEVAVGLRAAHESWDPTMDLLWERGLRWYPKTRQVAKRESPAPKITGN